MCERERDSRGVDVGVFLGRWTSTYEAGAMAMVVWLSQCSLTTVKVKLRGKE